MVGAGRPTPRAGPRAHDARRGALPVRGVVRSDERAPCVVEAQARLREHASPLWGTVRRPGTGFPIRRDEVDLSSGAHDAAQLAEHAHRLRPAPDIALRHHGVEEPVGIRHAPSVPGLEVEPSGDASEPSGDRDESRRSGQPAHVALGHPAPRLLRHPAVAALKEQETPPAPDPQFVQQGELHRAPPCSASATAATATRPLVPDVEREGVEGHGRAITTRCRRNAFSPRPPPEGAQRPTA